MNIVCASSLTLGREIFSTIGDVAIVPEKDIDAAVVKNADLLATRSKTRINEALLAGSSVQFYGTATAGTDHVDAEWMARSGLAWTAAPGCNANSVAEYVTAAILRDAVLRNLDLAGRSVVVIGAGQVGSRVVRKVQALGMLALPNDPPLSERTGDASLLELEDILPHADVVTLHVPFTQGVPFATDRMCGEDFFSTLKPGCLFINASRGEVVHENALLHALDRGYIRNMVLDVFNNEPDIRLDVVERAELVSPHIAGHSYEGKLNGTVMVYEAACRHFGLEPVWKSDPNAQPVDLRLDATGLRDEEALHRIVKQAYDIERDDRDLRAGASDMAKAFNSLRNKYWNRLEFPRHRVALAGGSPALPFKLRDLGFALV